jgi:hypothetical protein
MSCAPPSGRDPFAVLQQFVRRRPEVERCDLCGQILGSEHPHLLELASRRIACSCPACALLFSGQQGARYRRIPRDVRALTDLHFSDEQWATLCVPINLVFVSLDSRTSRVTARYPSPAGATEASLPPEAWPAVLERCPSLADMEADVEALLVNRIGDHGESFRVPIDECFRLVGLIRARWRGLSGGAEVRAAIDGFFADLRLRAGCGEVDDG